MRDDVARALAAKALEVAQKSKSQQGPKGATGDPGQIIVQRNKGDQGERGPMGPQGIPGKSIVGPQGYKGDKGDPGAKGDKGDQGEVGKEGAQGERGERGFTGPKGAVGSQGPVGPMPKHEKKGLMIRFEKEPGVFGEWIIMPTGGGGGGGRDDKLTDRQAELVALAEFYKTRGANANKFVKTDGTNLLWADGDGVGDVTGPSSSTNNAIALFDGTTGKLIKNGPLVGQPSGVATLDAGGKIPVSELPAAILGALNYQGTWDASTNTPTLTSSVGDKGYYYAVSVAGNTNLNGITDWLVGDWAVFNGTVWQKVDNTETVTSVNGQTGAVVLTTTNVAEGTNLYYTDARARTSVSAGTGISYNNSTGVVTNSAPDQTVAITAGTGISVTGTYPNFSVINTAPSSGGTVTSVTGTSPVVSSGGATPAISLATNYGDTQNPYASKTANFVLAAPNGSAGAPTFRAIVAADIPTLNQNTTGTSSNVTGIVAIANGGTGETTRQAAMDALAGAVTSGQYLRGNGTDVVMSAIQSADVPTLNQNTTGTSAGLSATLVATSGGTGQSTYAVGDLLVGAATNTLAKLADVATGNALISGGVGVAPSYGKVGLTTHVSGTLPVANGGTGTSTAFTAGSVVFAGASGVYSRNSGEFFWDNTNVRLGIRTASPGQALDVSGVGRFGELATKINVGLNGDSISSDGDLYIQTSASKFISIRANFTQGIRVHASGGVSIANSTDKGAGTLNVAGLIFPQQAASAPAYVKGAIYFDTTLNKLRVGGATAWETITSV